MGRKKILFLHISLGVGGAERLRYMLLRHIDRERYDIKLCCIQDKGEIGKRIEGLGYRVDELGLDYIFRNSKTTLKIARYLKGQRMDILQTALFDANFHGRIAALACSIPNVITEEHSNHYQYRGIKFLPYVISDFILARMTKAIVCCSETLRRDIVKKEKLPPSKVITIRNCIDPSMYEIVESREVVRQKLGIKDEKVFITVASLCNRKGHSYLLEALRGIKNKGFRFKCLLAGDGVLKEELYKKCRDYKLSEEVVFLGNVSQVADYLNASDIFVLPSVFEGLPIVLIEAMFMGLPCIATDVGAVRELITHNVNGTVVPPADEKKLMDAIAHCFNNEDTLKDFSSRSRKIVQEHCLVNAYVKQFCNLWDGLN